MKSKAIFLDRDGVLNHPVIRDGKSYPPARVEDVSSALGRGGYEGIQNDSAGNL